MSPYRPDVEPEVADWTSAKVRRFAANALRLSKSIAGLAFVVASLAGVLFGFRIAWQFGGLHTLEKRREELLQEIVDLDRRLAERRFADEREKASLKEPCFDRALGLGNFDNPGAQCPRSDQAGAVESGYFVCRCAKKAP